MAITKIETFVHVHFEWREGQDYLAETLVFRQDEYQALTGMQLVDRQREKFLAWQQARRDGFAHQLAEQAPELMRAELNGLQARQAELLDRLNE